MKILGIDPGTIVMGYGLIESDNDDIALIDFGAIVGPESSIGERLSYLYRELLDIIQRYQPDAVAVEQPFVAKNVKSAMAIGRAIIAATSARRPAVTQLKCGFFNIAILLVKVKEVARHGVVPAGSATRDGLDRNSSVSTRAAA